MKISYIKKLVGKEVNVDPKYLDYIGMTDEMETLGIKLWYFNIMDPSHSRYKSTVTYTKEKER